MKKIVTNLAIWAVSIIAFCIVQFLEGGDWRNNLIIVWGMSFMFFCLNYAMDIYIDRKMKQNTPIAINVQGVFGGRAIGVFLNIFLMEKIFDLDKHFTLNIILMLIGLIVALLFHRDFKDFWTVNVWKDGFIILYMAFTVVGACVFGLLDEKFRLIELGEVTLFSRAVMIVIFALIVFMTEGASSIVIRFASRNAERSKI